MEKYNIRIIINSIYNRRKRKSKIIIIIIILIFSISNLVNRGRERFKKFII